MNASAAGIRKKVNPLSLPSLRKAAAQGYFLAAFDIKSRYVRSVLGPFWLTLNAAIFIFSVGFVWAALFGVPLEVQLPFMAVSYTIWMFFQGSLLEATTAFAAGASFVRDRGMNWLTFCFVVFFRHLIYLMHTIVIALAVVIWFDKSSLVGALMALPGLAVFVLFTMLVIAPVAVVATRFHDVRAIIESSSVMLLLLTPVTWSPAIISDRGKAFVQLNPFAHLLALWREPFLNGTPASALSWAVAFVIIVVLFGLNVIALRRLRQVSFWV